MEGLKSFPPQLCEEGVGATYFLRNANNEIVAVFKPADEEDATKNPKSKDSGESGSPRKGILPGEAATREVAAYLLDDEGFYGVPPTYMVAIRHPFFAGSRESPKIGSLQKFIQHDYSSEDVGCSSFPTRQVHKIGLLDLQIMNTDRHGGNILVKELDDGGLELVPIDHGLSIPHTLDELWFEWMHWPQAKKPFDEETKAFIQRIDIEKNIRKLKDLGVRSDCLPVVRMATSLLKKGAQDGLTLFQIAQLFTRTNPQLPSILESLSQQLRALIPEANDKTMDQEAFNEISQTLIDEKIAQILQPKAK
jgi:hypothetical protein